MKNSTFCIRYPLLIIILVLLATLKGFGQRIYAGSQDSGAAGLLCLNCTVTNPSNAADGNIETFSTLNVTVGLAVQTYQEAIFSATGKVAGGTPVTVKLGTGNQLLDLTALGGITLQAFNGAAPIDNPIGAATLVTAVSNNNQLEVSITPSQTYDRIRVTLNGGAAGALSSIYFYEAFYNGNAPGACNSSVDELHGISAGLLNLGADVGGIVNPQYAIDGNLSTASTLNAGVGVIGAFAQQTVIYKAPSVIGDSIRMTLAIPQALIDAGVLSNISVSTFNGNVSNNDTQFLNSSLLYVRLLDLTNNIRKVTVTFAPGQVFDRVQLRLGNSIANVLSTLNLYEAQKLIPRPTVKFNNVITANAQICAGSTAILTTVVVPNTTYNWYTQATGGTAMATGATFTTPPLTATTTYYVSAMRTGCTDESERTPITVTVNATPLPPVIATNAVTVCPAQAATFTAAAITGVTVNWYTTAAGGTPVYSGNIFTTGALTATISYFAEAVAGGACTSPNRTQVTATVSSLPVPPALSSTNVTICPGNVAVLSVATPVTDVLYNWYSTATGGIPLYTGINFTTPALTATTNYYAEAVNSNGCSSSQRTTGTVTVASTPADPTLAANNLTISAGQTATISVSNAQTGIIYNWYNSLTAATPIFTGTPYVTPALYTSVTYYVNAVNSNGCVSADRTPITINVTINNNSPCTFANQQTTGAGGALCVLCGVSNAALAADADTTTASTITTTAGVLGGYAQQTLVFQQPGFAGDTIRLAIQTPVGLTDVSVLGLIQVTLFNGTTQVSQYTLDNSAIKLKLLGAGANRYDVYIPATGAYDRISIQLNSGVATLLTSLQVFYAVQQFPKPVFSPVSPDICKGSTAQINISSAANGGTFNWYTTPTGGTPVYTGSNFTTPPVNTNTTYYIEYSRGTCVSPVRTPVTVLENDPPVSPVVNPATATINSGQTATFTATVANNITVKWYSTATGVTPLYTGTTFTTPPLTANTDYYAESSAGSCVSPTRTHVTVTINPIVIPNVMVTPATQSVTAGTVATLTATSTTPGTIFNWFTTPAGGSSIFTGATFNTPAVNSNVTYYAEASVPATGAVSATRASGTITVNTVVIPNVTVTPATQAVTAGSVATLTATSTTPGTVFNWFTMPIGGTSIFTGATFNTPPVINNTTYYAEASVPATGAISATRASGAITVSSVVTPDVTVTPATQGVNAGTVTTLTAASTTPGAVFNWFTTPTGGTSIYTGATFNTPAVFSNVTYYAEASVPASGAVSANRASGTITLNTVAASPVACDAAIDQTTANSGVLCLGCVVLNPAGSVDADRNTFSQLNTLAGVVGAYQQQTLRFANTGMAGDSVIVELGIPGSLVSASLLSGISLATYNGTTYNNDRFNINPALISISLLNGTSRFRVAFVATSAFDRVEIRLNSALAGVLPALNIYDAYEEVASPVISASNVAACQGTQATLTATVPGYVTVKWYNTATGGTPVFTGGVFNTPALTTTTTYYAEASRTADGCTQVVRTPVTVNVTPTPAAPVINTPTVTVCAGQPATFTAQAVTGITFNWYTSPTGGTPVFIGNPFTTATLNATTSYYVEADGSTQCGSSTRTQVTAIVTGSPLVPIVSQTPVQTCSGSSAILTATSTQPGVNFNWYTTATGGTPVFTGAQYTTPVLTAYAAYYVEAASGTCTSPIRAEADVMVNPTPAAPSFTINPTSAQVTSGQTATITASSTAAGATFNWYTTATGGSPIFTGATFTTPTLTSNTTYYIESALATGCTSTARTAVNIIVSPIFSTTCDFASTQTTDVNGGLLCAGCAVTNPNYAVDSDTTNFSQLNLPVALVASYVGQTMIFGDTGNAGDTVTVRLSVPVSLLSAGVLSQIQIASYNSTAYNNDRINLSSNLIHVQLLAGGQTALIKFAPGASFDRVEVRLTGSVASLFGTLSVYYASKQVSAPQLTANTANICAGATATFTLTNIKADVTYKWYNTSTGGSPVFTGTTFTTGALVATTTYYVESDRTSNGCANPNRVAVTVNVTPSPVNPVLAASNLQICAGDQATFTITNASGLTINWYDAATGGNLLFTGSSFTVTPVSSAAYYAEATNGTCTSPARTRANVIVNPKPAMPGVAATNLQVCGGSSAMLQVITPEPGVTYNWYTTATGGTLIFAGTSFSTPAITQNTNYYVEAANTTTGCINNGGRTQVTITVNSPLAAPVLSATQTQVCNGGSITLSVNNPVAGITYNWFATAAGGTPIFTGSTFTVNNLTADISYFAEASGSAGCTSPTRTETDITVLPVPTAPQVTASTGGLNVCSGSSATLNISNPQANQVYRWFDAAKGGTLLYTGTQFITTALTTNTTYYVETATAGNCNASARTAVTIMVNALPADPTLATANISVCNGATAVLSISSPQAGITYNWYNSPAMTNLLFTGSTFTTGPITGTVTYYVSAVNASGCNSNNLAQAQVTAQPAPAAPIVANGNNVQSCSGAQVNLTIANPQTGFTYNWYAAATGGSPTFTGTSFITAALTANTSYFAEAVNNSGCTSAGRTEVDINVNPLPAAPTVTDGGGSATPAVCPGSSATLTAVSTTPNVSFGWYTQATGGMPIFTGTTYTTPLLNTATTYYVEAVSNTGNCSSGTRTAIQVTINNTMAMVPQVDPVGLTACVNAITTVNILNPDAGTTYNFYTVSTGGTPIATGTRFITPMLTANTTFYVEAVNSQSCNPSARIAFTVITLPMPLTPAPTAATVTICAGSTATLSIASPVTGLSYKWFDSPTRNNLVGNGPVFTSSPITVITTFYVESSNGSCDSQGLGSVLVNVIPAPSAPSLTNNAATACSGLDVSLSISNPQTGFTYNWYSDATGGNPLFTGTNFTTPLITANTTYYAEAVNSTGCMSVTRTAANITVLPAPSAPQLSTAGTTICPGTAATLTATASDPNATINWYASATGGPSLFTGGSFTTPDLTSTTTYYAETENTGGCSSLTRTAVTVTILQQLAAPIVSVTATTPTSVTFSWDAIAGATGYQVSLDNGQTFVDPTGGSAGLDYNATSLLPGQKVTIIVRSVGNTSCQLSNNSAAVTGQAANPLGNAIFVPNAFTPNGDGNNDVVNVMGNSIKALNFYVYDQWGELLFKTTNVSQGWDGTYKGNREPAGVYVYYAEIIMNDGTRLNKKGTITLIR